MAKNTPKTILSIQEAIDLPEGKTIYRTLSENAALMLYKHNGVCSWSVKYQRHVAGKSFSKQFKFGEFPDLTPEMAEEEAHILLATTKDLVDRQVERFKSSEEYLRLSGTGTDAERIAALEKQVEELKQQVSKLNEFRANLEG